MGVSANTVEQVQRDVVDIMSKTVFENASTCTSTAATSQTLNLGNIKGGLTIDGLSFSSDQTISMECLQSSENNTEIQRDIESNLTSAIKDKIDGFNISVSANNQRTLNESIKNLSSESIVRNMKSCMVNSLSNQSISAGNIEGEVNLKNINMDATQLVVAKCIQNDINVQKEINNIATALSAKTENTTLGFLNSTTLMIIIIVIAVIIGIIVIKKLVSK